MRIVESIFGDQTSESLQFALGCVLGLVSLGVWFAICFQ